MFSHLLVIGQCAVAHSLIDSGLFLVDCLYLVPYLLISIVVRSTGCRFIVFRQVYLDFTVFEEEIHIDSVAVFRISDVAVHYGILCAFECKCSVSDDSCVQFVELSVHTFLDKYSISVGSAFHSTCYYITGFVVVTRCHSESNCCNSQIS